MENEDKPVESIDEVIETLVPGMSLAEYERIRSEALENAKKVKHEWRMRGRGVLECRSCPFPHRAYIDRSKSLVGINADGTPILQ